MGISGIRGILEVGDHLLKPIQLWLTPFHCSGLSPTPWFLEELRRFWKLLQVLCILQTNILEQVVTRAAVLSPFSLVFTQSRATAFLSLARELERAELHHGHFIFLQTSFLAKQSPDCQFSSFRPPLVPQPCPCCTFPGACYYPKSKGRDGCPIILTVRKQSFLSLGGEGLFSTRSAVDDSRVSVHLPISFAKWCQAND